MTTTENPTPLIPDQCDIRVELTRGGRFHYAGDVRPDKGIVVETALALITFDLRGAVWASSPVLWCKPDGSPLPGAPPGMVVNREGDRFMTIVDQHMSHDLFHFRLVVYDGKRVWVSPDPSIINKDIANRGKGLRAGRATRGARAARGRSAGGRRSRA